MKNIKIILIIFLMTCGCASAQVKQINDYNVPFKGSSFSILPPQGNDWFYSEKRHPGSYLLAFSKKSTSPTHTLSAIVIEENAQTSFYSPDQFLNWVKNNRGTNPNPSRFKLIENQIVLDNTYGKDCVRYFLISHDYGAANKGASKFLVMKISGYIFIHPKFSDTIIDISYSERGQTNELLPGFKQNAMDFIKRLNLE